MLNDFGILGFIVWLLFMMFLYILVWLFMLFDLMVNIFCRVYVVLYVFSVYIFILLKCWLLNWVLLFRGCWVIRL